MKLNLKLSVALMCCLGFTLTAAGQLDSSGLRAKYGVPLDREIFRMPAGFDLIVDYGASHQVCRLEVPALMPSKEKISNLSTMKQRMYDFLSELVPSAVRGKESGRIMGVEGMISLLTIQYEHVTVNQMEHANEPFGNNTIVVAFHDIPCQDPSSHR
jgi:hypothetical protein